MAWNLGRILGLNEPTLWQATGDHVTVTGSYAATSLADGRNRREQILAYANNVDEPIVPLTIDGEPQLAGYYRVLGAQLLSDEFHRKRGNIYDFQIDLERMPGFASPLIESTLIGGLIPNFFSVVAATAQPWHGVPAAMLDYSPGTLIGGSAQLADRVAEDGTVKFTQFGANQFKNIARGALSPASFYISAAQIQGGLLTSVYPVVGHQVSILKDDWRLTNGLTRVQSSPNHDGLQVSWYTGSAWGALKNFRLNYTNAGVLAEDPSIRIMRNDPCEVVIRMTLHATAVGFGPVFLDIALRRGARVVRCYLSATPVSGVDTWGLTTGGNPVSAALTAGTRQTTQDADLNRIILTTSGLPGNSTFTTGTAILNGTSGVAFDFGIGAEVGTAAAGNTGQDLVYQYLAGQAESQRVVVR